jgi:hypothetical protein
MQGMAVMMGAGLKVCDYGTKGGTVDEVWAVLCGGGFQCMFFFNGHLLLMAQCPPLGFPTTQQLKQLGGHLQSMELCAPPHTMEQCDLVTWSHLPHMPHHVNDGGHGHLSTL